MALLKQEKRQIFKTNVLNFFKTGDKARLSRQMDEILKQIPLPKKIKMALYFPFQNEVDVRSITKWHSESLWFYPQLHGENLKFVLVHRDTPFEKSKKGFFQPLSNIVEKTQNIDVFFVPALAVDRNFQRLGRGLGCYDRALRKAKKTALKIGAVWSAQMDSDLLPYNKKDQKMDAVVTENWIAYAPSFFKKYQKRIK